MCHPIAKYHDETEMAKLKKELEELKAENEALKKIAAFASWTNHGSRIYKALPQMNVCSEFYMGIHKTYRDYEKEFLKKKVDKSEVKRLEKKIKKNK